MEKISIIGAGQTKQERRKLDQSFADMVFESVNKALADAQIEIKDIDNIITASNDFWDGRTISSMAIQDACGSFGKNISTVEGDGTFASFYGMTRILSGSYKNTLIVAHSKGSEGDTNLITNSMFDPIFVRSLGLDNISAAAMQARAYMHRFNVTEEDMAMVSVKNHRNAINNTNAQITGNFTVEDVMKSRKIADPLKLFDVSPISDGAAAIIISGEEFAGKLNRKNPVYLSGVGFCAETHELGERDLTESKALRQASAKAYEMAGIKNPLKDLDVAEIYDAFSYQELMWYEGLNFCAPGQGKDLIRNGSTDMKGILPVNPSGGVFSAHSVITAGLIRMIEASKQLRGEAGAMQIEGASRALAHGINGACGQSHCVWVMENVK